MNLLFTRKVQGDAKRMYTNFHRLKHKIKLDPRVCSKNVYYRVPSLIEKKKIMYSLNRNFCKTAKN